VPEYSTFAGPFHQPPRCLLGCSETERPFLTGADSRVVLFDEVVVMLNVYSNNFFHQLVELVPAFMQVLPLLTKKPSLPILVTKEISIPELLRFVGIDERKLNFVFVRRGDPLFFYGRTVYFPLFPPATTRPRTSGGQLGTTSSRQRVMRFWEVRFRLALRSKTLCWWCSTAQIRERGLLSGRQSPSSSSGRRFGRGSWWSLPEKHCPGRLRSFTALTSSSECTERASPTWSS